MAAITLFCLVPFAGKPFHIDDPLFIWTAQHIQRHPTDFYGFEVNWYGYAYPMSKTMKNPPLTPYYLALAGTLVGFREIALHLAYLLPNFALVAGVYFLARRFCQYPLIAACAALFTPAALVSATSVMCDTTMLALWCWALVCWLEGLKRRRIALLIVAAALIGLAGLTKYFAIALIPLVILYTLADDRRNLRWLPLLMIPIAMLWAYDYCTDQLYGRPLLQDASLYANFEKHILGMDKHRQALIASVFLGGCFVTVLCYAPLLWRWRQLAIAALLLVAGVLIGCKLFNLPVKLLDAPLDPHTGSNIFVPIHVCIFLLASAALLVLLLLDLWQHRNAASFLLVLWALGTFVFTGFINWTVNARSLLPLAPVLGILVARRVERRFGDSLAGDLSRFVPHAAAALAISLAVAWGDYSLARSAKSAAQTLCTRFGIISSPLWFEGHWGFQYYMQNLGARPIDFSRDELPARAELVIPRNNTNLYFFPPNMCQKIAELPLKSSGWVSTLAPSMSASFYAARSDILLPFAFAPIPRETYDVFQLNVTIGFDKNTGVNDPGNVLDRD